MTVLKVSLWLYFCLISTTSLWIPASLPGHSICSHFCFALILIDYVLCCFVLPLGVIRRLEELASELFPSSIWETVSELHSVKSFPMNSRILMLKALVLFHRVFISLLSARAPQGSFQILTVGTWWSHCKKSPWNWKHVSQTLVPSSLLISYYSALSLQQFFKIAIQLLLPAHGSSGYSTHADLWCCNSGCLLPCEFCLLLGARHCRFSVWLVFVCFFDKDSFQVFTYWCWNWK